MDYVHAEGGNVVFHQGTVLLTSRKFSHVYFCALTEAEKWLFFPAYGHQKGRLPGASPVLSTPEWLLIEYFFPTKIMPIILNLHLHSSTW